MNRSRPAWKLASFWRCAWMVAVVSGLTFMAAAQSPLPSTLPSPLPSHTPDSDAQRARIVQERKTIEVQFALDEAACYQRFAVTDCLTQRRRERRDKVSDLRRQEVLLNLADARARGSEQISNREARLSTESLVQDANRLLEAQASQQQRLALIDGRIAARQQALAQEAENTRLQMARETQKREENAQRESRRAEEAANQRAYDERQLRAQQKTQERLKREDSPARPQEPGLLKP